MRDSEHRDVGAPGGESRAEEAQERYSLFPIFLSLTDELCTVVGGGEVAARKVASLLAAGATVRMIAPQLSEAARSLLGQAKLTHLAREYQVGDLRGSTLAFAATDAPRVNAAVYREASQSGIPVNVADNPAQCTFFLPAKLQRGPIAIAISTQGASPALARQLRERIETAVPAAYGRLAQLLGRLRPELAARVTSSEERARRWRQVLDGKVLALLEAGREHEAEALARRVLGLWANVTEPAGGEQVVIGTRGSKLALAQTQLAVAMLERLGVSAEVKVIRTAGDASRAPRLESGTGMFVKEIEHALLAGDVNLAVHSLKDLPTGDRPGLALAAVPERADPHDALVTGTGVGLARLAPGCRVATSSPRREAQLRAFRPDLVFVPVRGNVDTRLRKLAAGQFDALVVAYAGLVRLGRADHATELIPFEICLPAPGQGALAVQARADDLEMRQLAGRLDHRPTRLAATAERSFLARLAAGCTVPAGALGTVDDDRLLLQGVVAEVTGKQVIRRQVEGRAEEAEALGVKLAEEMLAAGAGEILAAARC